MSFHGPLIFDLLIDKSVESTQVSKPVSTLTVHTVHREGMDGGEQEKKKRSFAYHPTPIPSCFASQACVDNKKCCLP